MTAFINGPETVALQRDRGVLKRLRGTPLPAWAYLTGRLISVVWFSALAVLAVLPAGGCCTASRCRHGPWCPSSWCSPPASPA
jgi:hypothetical protein